MKQKYLLCPQCGLHRFYIEDKDSGQIYFHVDHQYNPFPTRSSRADLSGMDFSIIKCPGCSWKGGLKALVRYFR